MLSSGRQGNVLARSSMILKQKPELFILLVTNNLFTSRYPSRFSLFTDICQIVEREEVCITSHIQPWCSVYIGIVWPCNNLGGTILWPCLPSIIQNIQSLADHDVSIKFSTGTNKCAAYHSRILKKILYY